MIFLFFFGRGVAGMRVRILGYKFWKYRNVLSILATSFGIALPAWIVDQKNSILVSLFKSHYNMFDVKRAITMKILVCYFKFNCVLWNFLRDGENSFPWLGCWFGVVSSNCSLKTKFWFSFGGSFRSGHTLGLGNYCFLNFIYH